MEFIIQKYLSKFYEVETSEVGNDGIYLISDKRKFRAPIYGSQILDELIIIFYISEDEGKEFITKWGESINPEIDLVFYWKTNEQLIFPMLNRVMGTTLANEIILVSPLSGPSGELFWVDPVINGVDYTGTTDKNYEVDETDNDFFSNTIEALTNNRGLELE